MNASDLSCWRTTSGRTRATARDYALDARRVDVPRRSIHRKRTDDDVRNHRDGDVLMTDVVERARRDETRRAVLRGQGVRLREPGADRVVIVGRYLATKRIVVMREEVVVERDVQPWSNDRQDAERDRQPRYPMTSPHAPYVRGSGLLGSAV